MSSKNYGGVNFDPYYKIFPSASAATRALGSTEGAPIQIFKLSDERGFFYLDTREIKDGMSENARAALVRSCDEADVATGDLPFYLIELQGYNFAYVQGGFRFNDGYYYQLKIIVEHSKCSTIFHDNHGIYEIPPGTDAETFTRIVNETRASVARDKFIPNLEALAGHLKSGGRFLGEDRSDDFRRQWLEATGQAYVSAAEARKTIAQFKQGVLPEAHPEALQHVVEFTLPEDPFSGDMP